MANPIAIAAKGKGYTALIKRIRAIGKRYGLTVATMDQALQVFVGVLQEYGCGASFPITASALARHGPVIEKYQAQNIEFAIHGLFHVDYSHLSWAEQDAHLKRARRIFNKEHINLTGFRCPYLRWNDDTLTAVGNNNLGYDSSQAFYWDVVEGYDTAEYHHVLGFYGAKSAADYPALPKIIGPIIQIPYCLPDDEALIDRLKLSNPQVMSEIWSAVLTQTYTLGELFTLGLHPERIRLLQKPLANTLAQARSLSKIWIARLDEIAQWWRARSQTTFAVTREAEGVFDLTINGPSTLTVLARKVKVEASTQAGYDDFQSVAATRFRFQSQTWPCIGLSPDSDPALRDFLTQQGYWVETRDENKAYSIQLHQTKFSSEDERPLLRQLTRSDAPLICLGRWPDGARSAMCVTGDIDALTLWDYALRFLGR